MKKFFTAFAVAALSVCLFACSGTPDLPPDGATGGAGPTVPSVPVDDPNAGGGAGGRMAATISSYGVQPFGGTTGIPKSSTAVIQYTAHTDYNKKGETATFVTVGENDGIASYRTMKSRIDKLAAMGVPTEYHSYAGLSHGFGLGVGTIAEGWIDKAIAFWESNIVRNA